MLDQYDRLRKRNAFLEQYKKEDMFSNGLEEFDDSRSVPILLLSILDVASEVRLLSEGCRRVVQELADEYRACESPDYVNYD